LHDCDIVTYTRELPARLIYPVAHPNFNYRFCKGYYARVSSGRIHGRVCRLLVTPLIRSLKDVIGNNNYLSYLDSFRYPLAGEFSMRTDVLDDLRIPQDWGLEIGVISELSRNYSVNRICQVDIADNYDHKHQVLSPEDASRGLSKMSLDICKAVFRKLATQGVVFSEGTFRTLKASYYRKALDMMTAYHNDAVINGLHFSQHDEEAAVELFAENLMAAGASFLNHPMETPFIPSWNRVISAVPDIFERLRVAVDADRKEFALSN
jgi:glucosyl-3-phosphoglycerate synthase